MGQFNLIGCTGGAEGRGPAARRCRARDACSLRGLEPSITLRRETLPLSHRAAFRPHLIEFALHPAGLPEGEAVGRDIRRHQAAGADGGASADGNSRKDYRAGAEPHPIADGDGERLGAVWRGCRIVG